MSAAVAVEALGAALLLRGGTGPVGALRAVTTALQRAHPETVLVTAPAVTGRDGLFALVAEALAGAPPSENRLRLVLLGRGPDAAARRDGARLVARRLGRPVTVSLGPVTVALDGTCVSVAEPDGRRPDLPDTGAGWYAVGGAGPAEEREEPPWSPAPPWSTLPAPQRWAGPDLVARPVPAGLWLVPPDVRPGGTVGGLPREPDAATIFVGGCGAPVPVAELCRAVAALRPDPVSRLVLLPGAVPAGTPPARLRHLPVRLRSAVPALTPTGRRLVPVASDGTVVAAVGEFPSADGPDPVGGVPPDAAEPGRPAGAAGPPPHSGSWTPPGPDPAGPAPRTGPYTTGRRPVTGHATAAGWSFLDGADDLGVTSAAAGTVVEVATDHDGFVVGDRVIDATDFADLLTAVLGPGVGPLVLAGPDDGRPTSLAADLAAARDATVLTSAGPVALTATGVLLASAGFRAHRPAAPSRPVGSVLPASGAGLDDLAARSTPYPPPASGPAAADAEGTRMDPASGLLAALGPAFPRYAAELADAHHRAAVTPGEEPRPELVALWVYGTHDRADVNAYLREAPASGSEPVDGDRASRAAAVANGVVAALPLLPVVFGPVFAATGVPAVGTPGQHLTEPGFVDARLVPGGHLAASVEYVIWSMTARRLDGVFVAGAPVAVFPPGSRFEVLAVDPVGERFRVYLADLGAGRPADPDELLARLRRDVPDAPDGDAPLIAPIGFADAGRPFAGLG
ncbi:MULTISPECIES: hypothetical protein [unclassified Micromonospora]|uniref:hypothetical protein n=1 Tax=unclassified Micromonospora TaxID=2617518 RepID=UPI0022CCCDBB|nr:hypothetical protein [Micromonospora sp. AKA38]GHJ15383.1 hypothetical protein TPA0908_33780 [Micromonospora sp. AKA38]